MSIFCSDKNEPCLIISDFQCNYVRRKGFVFFKGCFLSHLLFPFLLWSCKNKDNHLKDRPEAILMIVQFTCSMEIQYTLLLRGPPWLILVAGSVLRERTILTPVYLPSRWNITLIRWKYHWARRLIGLQPNVSQ